MQLLPICARVQVLIEKADFLCFFASHKMVLYTLCKYNNTTPIGQQEFWDEVSMIIFPISISSLI